MRTFVQLTYCVKYDRQLLGAPRCNGTTLTPVGAREWMKQLGVANGVLESSIVDACANGYVASLAGMHIGFGGYFQNERLVVTGAGEKFIGMSPNDDLITTDIACSEYVVSRPTLLRAVADGSIRSHRPLDAPENASHLFQRQDIANRFRKRISR